MADKHHIVNRSFWP